MRKPVVALVLATATTLALAQHGLQWGKPVADHTVQLAVAGWSIGLRAQMLDHGRAPLGLFGDHYLTGPGFGGDRVTGGLRLSGGLSFDGWRQGAEGWRRLPGSHAEAATTQRPGDPGWAIQPYVGIGYTSLSARAGWGFAADLGLGGLRPGAGVRLGQGGRSGYVEQWLDDLRLAPVVQVGVSYAF